MHFFQKKQFNFLCYKLIMFHSVFLSEISGCFFMSKLILHSQCPRPCCSFASWARVNLWANLAQLLLGATWTMPSGRPGASPRAVVDPREMRRATSGRVRG